VYICLHIILHISLHFSWKLLFIICVRVIRKKESRLTFWEWLVFLTSVANFIEQSPSWEANSRSAIKKSPAFYFPRRFITVFTKSNHWTMLFWIVTSCRLVVRYHRFGETYCLHPRNLRVHPTSQFRTTSTSSPPKELQISDVKFFVCDKINLSNIRVRFIVRFRCINRRK
jgi:hypothetical protein